MQNLYDGHIHSKQAEIVFLNDFIAILSFKQDYSILMIIL